MMKRRGLILFLKYPEVGKVKTRLAKDIGDTLAAGLYECFVSDLVEKLVTLDCDLHLFMTPREKLEDMQEWLAAELPLHVQEGADLGERMEHAFLKLFRLGYETCVIMGSDLPDVPVEIPREAFKCLEFNPAVIGPSQDGGYYLIGFQRSSFCRAVFHQVEWSTEQVFRQTMAIFQREALKPEILREWQDIDSVEDLEDLFDRSLDNSVPFNSSRTMRYLQQHRQEIFK
jgi:rSAM/selenodomain-associated transferase 1